MPGIGGGNPGPWSFGTPMGTIASGEITIGVAAQDVACTTLADGDFIEFALKSAGGTPANPVVTDQQNGVKFIVAGSATNTSTYRWCTRRLVRVPPVA